MYIWSESAFDILGRQLYFKEQGKSKLRCSEKKLKCFEMPKNLKHTLPTNFEVLQAFYMQKTYFLHSMIFHEET